MSISTRTPRVSPGRRSAGAVMRGSRGPREQGAQADQVVRRGGEGDDPIDEFATAMPELAQTADGLQPAKDLLDQFPFLLADRVAGMPRGPLVDRAAGNLLRDVRRDAERAHAGDEAGD